MPAVQAGAIGAPTLTAASGAASELAAVAGAAAGSSAAAGASGVGLLPLFVTLLKIGSVLFGSGYVLLAFLRTDLVERLGWITEAQLLDAIAVGQVTPGPLFTSATFIGFLVAGVPGAAVATVAIFLPAFVFVALSGPLLPRIRRSPSAGAVLDGVNAASVALMAVVSAQLARAAIVDVPTAVLAAGALAALTYTRLGTVWLIAAGAAVGLAAR
jgi:chromate transporter